MRMKHHSIIKNIFKYQPNAFGKNITFSYVIFKNDHSYCYYNNEYQAQVITITLIRVFSFVRIEMICMAPTYQKFIMYLICM